MKEAELLGKLLPGHPDIFPIIQNIREKYQTAETGCGSCVLNCGTFYDTEEGPYGRIYSEGPEWETVNSFGARLGIADPLFVMKANEFCNIQGLDISSAGCILGFVMELFEKGLLEKEVETVRKILHHPQILERQYINADWHARTLAGLPGTIVQDPQIWSCICLEIWLQEAMKVER